MKRLLLLLSYIVSVTIPIVVLGGVKIRTEKIYEQGVIAYEHEDYEKSLKLLENALQNGLNHDKLPGAYLRLYMGSLVLNDNDKKDYYLEQCKSVIPEFDITYTEGQRRLLKLINPFTSLNPSKYKPPMNQKHINVPKGNAVSIGATGIFIIKVKDFQVRQINSQHLFITTLEFYSDTHQLQGTLKTITYDSVTFPAVFGNVIITQDSYGDIPNGGIWCGLKYIEVK